MGYKLMYFGGGGLFFCLFVLKQRKKKKPTAQSRYFPWSTPDPNFDWGLRCYWKCLAVWQKRDGTGFVRKPSLTCRKLKSLSAFGVREWGAKLPFSLLASGNAEAASRAQRYTKLQIIADEETSLENSCQYQARSPRRFNKVTTTQHQRKHSENFMLKWAPPVPCPDLAVWAWEPASTEGPRSPAREAPPPPVIRLVADNKATPSWNMSPHRGPEELGRAWGKVRRVKSQNP